MNVVALEEFELASYDPSVKQFNHYSTGFLQLNGNKEIRPKRKNKKFISLLPSLTRNQGKDQDKEL